MTRMRLALLGLCAAAFATVVFGAPAAQANEWLILTSGGQLKTATELPASIGGEIEKEDAALLTEILGAQVKILCTAGTLIGVKLEGGGTLTNGGKVQFTGCKTYLEGEEAPECEAKSAGRPNGTIQSNALKGNFFKVLKKIIKIVAAVGTLLEAIELGSSCPIGTTVPIEGALAFEDCEGSASAHLVTHLFVEEPEQTTLTALGEPATIDGSTRIFLTGAHSGLAWAGDA